MPKMKKKEEPCPIRIVDAEERRQIMARRNRGEFLNRLENVVNEPAFSVKNVRKKQSNLGNNPEEDNKKSFDRNSSDAGFGDVITSDNDLGKNTFLDDDQWSDMMDAFDELDPMDEITSSEKYSYRGKKGKNPFEDKFSKEYSMVHSLLSDVQKESKLISKQLQAMGMGSGKKGASGVSKYLIDLVNASASLHGTQLQAVKELVNIKKTISDLEMKDAKNNPKEEETPETSASRFYDHIIGGGRNNFINAVKDSIEVGVGDYGHPDAQPDEDGSSNISNRSGFNISQPLPSTYDDNDDGDDEYDKYNYIQNEHSNVSVCIQRFDDGDFCFIALDEDGEEIMDYEVPGDGVLATIQFSPTSNLATDKFGRKYRIIDVDTSPTTY